jgi:hypothetical protein
VAGDAETMAFLVFETDDPASEDAPFLGMEHIVHSDLFRGPAVPDGPTEPSLTCGVKKLDRERRA